MAEKRSAAIPQLNEFEPKLTAYGQRRFAQRIQGHGVVLRIEQPVESRAARAHPPRHLGFGKLLFFHSGRNLPRENALKGCRCHFLINAFLAETAIE
jgi:hypothetical protein